MLKNQESQARTINEQQPTTGTPFYTEKLKNLSDELFKQVEDFFMKGGLSMPLKLLHDFACEISENLHKKDEGNEDEDFTPFTTGFVAGSFFDITFIMWKLSELYETYRRITDLNGFIEEER